MGKVVAQNQQNVSLRIKMLVNATGLPALGIIAADSGHVISYQRGENTAFVTDGGSAADMSAITNSHVDWEFEEIGEGWYRVDYPDAAFLEGKGSVLCTMITDIESAIAVTVDIEPFFRYQGLASAATAETTTFPAGTTPYKGDSIYVTDGTGIGQTRLVQSVSTEVATHAAWDINISTSASTILLIAGDPLSATAAINADVANSTRSTLGISDVKGEADQALVDSPDLATVKGKTDKLTFDASNLVSSELKKIHGTALKQDAAGTEADPFGPA